MISRRFPSYCSQPDYSRTVYPDPPSHDFVTWLIIAEMMRRYHKAPGPLRVRFLMQQGMLGTVDFSHYSIADGRAYQCGVSRAYFEQMFKNVMLPAMEMIGAVRELPDLNAEECYDTDLVPYVEWDYHLSNLIDAARGGCKVPLLSTVHWADEEADEFLDGKPTVVITLRESTVQPERNSQLEEWLKFARSIEYPVLFVRDTAKADVPLPFPTWPRASRNAYVRAALYRKALCNLMVCTGPVNWCDFTDAPLLLFKQLVPALPQWAAGQPDGWREQCHMEVGDQLPWALPTQRFTWADDTFENIRAEFDNFMGAHGRHA